MVKQTIFILFLLFGLYQCLLQGETLVETSIDSTRAQANYPVIGLLTITHSEKDKVDPHSFRLEGKSLEASLLQQTKMTVSSDTVVSIYQFQLPAQKQGTYLLPAVSVKVGRQIYQSLVSPYFVRGADENQPASPSSSSPFLGLKAKIEGPLILYPGQRTKLIYQISFNQSIDLTRSILPFASSPLFQKIGDVQIQDFQQGGTTTQELSQEIEASQTGTFFFGPALIEGYVYTLQGDQKIYSPTLLHAEAPAMSLEVKAFPRLKQPPSFTGALGRLEAQEKLLTPSSLQVGDRLLLQIQLKGAQPLADLKLPSLACQPGFSGFFQMSDLPPQAEIKEAEKIFQIELRALTSLIDQIPSIEFSSFDPEKEAYYFIHTPAIPLILHPRPPSPSEFSPLARLFPFPSLSLEGWPSPYLPSLALPIVPVLSSSLVAKKKTSILEKRMGIFVFALGVLLLQLYLKRKKQQKPIQKLPSEVLFDQALHFSSHDPEKSLFVLEKALWTRLWEKRKIPSGSFSLDSLSLDPALAPIQSFLFVLQALQYSSNKNFNSSIVINKALTFFKTLQ